MNGIGLQDTRTFFRWYFSQIPFVTADEADIDQHFFGFDFDEMIGGTRHTLQNVAAGLTLKTHTGADGTEIYQVSSMSDEVAIDIVLVKKVEVKDFRSQEEAHDQCKHELNNLVSWLFEQRTQGLMCDYPVVAQVQLDRIGHQKLAGVADHWYGWKIRLFLRSAISETIEFDPVSAPPVFDVPDGYTVQYNGTTHQWEYVAFPSSSAAWGDITGTLSDQTDLQNALNAKATVVALTAEAATRAAADTAEAAARTAADAALQSDIDDHLADMNNPHQTSLTQVAAQDNYVDNNIDANGYTVTNLAAPSAASDAATKAYVDGLIDTALKAPEAFTPAGTYPTTYGGNAIQKGDTFRMAAAGTMGSVTVNTEDLLIALIDAPGQTGGNWQVLESNRDQASESVKGVALIASQAQAENELTSNNTDIMTPQKTWLSLVRDKAIAWTWALKQTFTTAPRFSSVTANHVLTVDGSKDLTSEAKGTAFNKDFGTGTSNVPEIGSTLGNSLAVVTSAAGKLITSTVADFKTWLALAISDISGLQTALDKRVEIFWNASVTHTGTTTDTAVLSKQMPANYWADEDDLEIALRGFKTGTAALATWDIYFNTSNSLSGATKIASGANFAAATTINALERSMMFQSSGTKLVGWPPGSAVANDVNNTTTAYGDHSYDVTQAYYLIVAVKLNNSADSIKVHVNVKKIKALA